MFSVVNLFFFCTTAHSYFVVLFLVRGPYIPLLIGWAPLTTENVLSQKLCNFMLGIFYHSFLEQNLSSYPGLRNTILKMNLLLPGNLLLADYCC